MRNVRLGVLVLGSMLGLVPGCMTQNCTDMGWQEGLTVNVTSDEPLTAGTYRFVVEIPGQTFELELPIEEPENTDRGIYASDRVTRDKWQLNLSLTGSSQFGVNGSLVIGRFNGASGGPESITLTVLQDDVQIGELDLPDIEYDEREPNGPDCGVATTATASIAITPIHSEEKL